MPALIEARELTKKFGAHVAVDHANFTIESGRIVGLIGPNGAGKTTALRALLGLTTYEGTLRVDQAIDFVAAVHPRFRRERAVALLEKTQIRQTYRMRELSKGMKTQVHLALTMAIDAKLFVLDEPTLGLDLLARRAFYDALVDDYMDETRTILVTTHQVEEVENLLTDVMFIDKGRIVLDSSIEAISERYAAVVVNAAELEAARALGPFFERRTLGKTILYFEAPDRANLERLGEILTPSISDLFVAKLSGSAA